ncbi:MAG: hypothetical protein H0U58_05925 [Chloroflexi bacterium]|nr:hypothetical protein [Chloroflexota bacterium]
MIRRPRSLPSTARRLGLVAALATVAVACGGTPPSAPALVDPREILSAAATHAASARSVHVDVTADGQLALDLLGTGVTSAPISLADTTASLDADLSRGATRATFSAPGILGIRGEAIVVDGVSYVKTSLTGPLYQAQGQGAVLASPSPAPGASGNVTAGIMDGVIAFLREPGVEPIKNPDAACGGSTCYSVSLDVGADRLGPLLGGAGSSASLPIPLPDLSGATARLTFLVERDPTRLASLDVVADLGDTGNVVADLTFSKWDEAVTISAPSPDQVRPG